ncbi:MAG: NAD-dependent succinate-semialdehyde dehydrogenase [Ignavibacteria bacterium]|jgi:succinate-semialdehyde dehydrogenase/glutarate-semialdehyde dehydrogenase
MSFTSVNPATGLSFAVYSAHTHEDVQMRIESASQAQQRWTVLTIEERVGYIHQLAVRLEAHVEPVARLITREMGKPLEQSRAEVLKCAAVCRYMAQIAPAVLADEYVQADFASSTIRYEPLGIVFSIMPWNFPLWQFFRFAVPALLAGNAVLVKHAPSTMGCGMIAVRLCQLAGIDEHLVADLRISVDDVEGVIADDRIRAVTFTGSTQGGSAVAALAGTYLKKSVMELGGSDPYIICDDADIDVAIDMCVASRMVNTGQSCIAAKRYIVHQTLADEFIRRTAQRFDQLVVGDPMDQTSQLGPLARFDLKEQLMKQVEDACSAGARIATSRAINDAHDEGFYVNPTLLIDIEQSNPVAQQELFGPVAMVHTYHDIDHAIALANATPFGLGAAVCSRNIENAQRIASRLECGTVFINEVVRSDARLPFGGVKQSGYGRELGRWGMLEFVNVKNVTIG